jgi:signal transduction histidine kinase/CheY-like chemotaxis protein
MFQANPEAIPFFLATAISGALAVWAWRRRKSPQFATFACIMAGEASWALFEALELVTMPLRVKYLWFELRTAGATFAVLAVLALVLRYVGLVQWLRPRRFSIVCAPAVVTIALAWTNPLHHLFWKRLWNEDIGGYLIAMPGYGPAFWCHFAYCYLLVAVTTVLLANAVFRLAGLYRAQAAVMLFAVTLPWIVNMIDMSQIFGFIHVDSAAMTFAVTGLLFLPGLFRFRLFDLAPVAWAAVVSEMNDPVVVIDPFGRIVDLNPAAARLAGGELARPIGADAAATFSHWPGLAARLKEPMRHSELNFPLDGPCAGVEAAYDARISRLGKGLDPAGWVLVLRDITQHRRAAEDRMRALHDQAARAQAEAESRAKDRLLATVSHELRTPLTPVLATVTAMSGDPATPEALRPVLEMIRRNVALEARIVDDLLDLARIHRGTLCLTREVVDAHELVDHVIAICRDDVDRANIRLVVDLHAIEHHLDADPIRLQQVLWNLLKNAIKFTPIGGSITVRSESGTIDANAPKMLEHVETNGQPLFAGGAPVLLIEVSDTGVGIAPDDLPRIFDVLEHGGSTSARQFGGLGLGLTICRAIVEQHGGHLAAASAGRGKGATFTLALPAAAPAAAAPKAGEPAGVDADESALPPQPLHILLVEDNIDTLNSLSRLFTLRGYSVERADSVKKALAIAAESQFDVLVSDIELPDGNGLELVARLREIRIVPAIALSGFGSPADVEHSLAAGFSLHLVKPVDFRRLESAVRQVARAGAVAGALER